MLNKWKQTIQANTTMVSQW